jgi:hypothetical protein
MSDCGLEKLLEEHLSDSRQGLNKQFTLTDLLRQSVYSRLAGYEDLNDAERLAADPTFRLISSQQDLAPGRGTDLDLALVRDRAADQGRESDRADGFEPGDARAAECLDSSDRVVLDMTRTLPSWNSGGICLP